MRTESGVRARSDNPGSRGPAPNLLRVRLHSNIETVTAPGRPPQAFHPTRAVSSDHDNLFHFEFPAAGRRPSP